MLVKSVLDPKKLAGDNFDALNDKLKVSKMIVARNPKVGGSPFVWIFGASMLHYLEDFKPRLGSHQPEDIEEECKDEEKCDDCDDFSCGKKDKKNKDEFSTAATDGKKYYWHPKFVSKLTPIELCYVLCHETYHVVCQHCDKNRISGKNKKVWNISVDYVVNSMLEHDYRKAKYITDTDYSIDNHPIWGGNLGKPYPLQELLDDIDKQAADIQNGREEKGAEDKEGERRMFADYSMYGKSPEEIYDTIMDHLQNKSATEINKILEGFNNSIDQHKESSINRKDLLSKIIEAASATKKLVGTVPSSIEDQLAELQNPKLSWQDFVRVTLQKRRHEKGQINDWSRFRRRALSMGMYAPKKKDDHVRWLCLLDSSGSMSNEDMAFGVSQLRALDGRSEGIVVCCDADTYWDKAKNINKMDELPSINVVGRGGTAFRSFFEDWRDKLGNNFDMIIVLTDGGIFDMGELKPPGLDTVWVLTSGYYDFSPPFGRVAPLRGM